MKKHFQGILLATVVSAVAGCFNEPTPAYKTVPEGARLYLNDKGFCNLAVEPIIKADPVKVDYINLDRNQITNLNGVARFNELKWLRLNGNKLSSLPDLKPLVKLRRIYLKNNRFEKIPDAINDLPSLTDLDISGNPIAEIPEFLAKKNGLKNLSFNDTRISKLPEDISAWQGLQSLQLGGLRISSEEMARIRKQLPNVAIVF